jgi:hypothetical protein
MTKSPSNRVSEKIQDFNGLTEIKNDYVNNIIKIQGHYVKDQHKIDNSKSNNEVFNIDNTPENKFESVVNTN